MIEVSVIIPVYNAEKFIVKAVESALNEPEVCEVILVEDKSPDGCLLLCQQLARENDKVKLFRHPNGENRGAAASRNLGVLKSTTPYIAFLDADDFYLPGRFKRAAELFVADNSIDGVYDAIGLHIYSSHGRERYESYKGRAMDPNQLLTINRPVPPEELFELMLLDKLGIFHANGITLRRDFVIDVGLFDEDLNIVEDTVLWFKLAYHGKLVAGNLTDPVARQGIHDENREPDMKPALLFQKYRRLFTYFLDKQVKKKVLRVFFTRMMSYHPERKHSKGVGIARKLELIYLVIKEIFKNPSLLVKLV